MRKIAITFPQTDLSKVSHNSHIISLLRFQNNNQQKSQCYCEDGISCLDPVIIRHSTVPVITSFNVISHKKDAVASQSMIQELFNSVSLEHCE